MSKTDLQEDFDAISAHFDVTGQVPGFLLLPLLAKIAGVEDKPKENDPKPAAETGHTAHPDEFEAIGEHENRDKTKKGDRP